MLDLFCGAGGAAMGYHRAGFEVFGVDIDPKPLRHYPFPYVCADALEYCAEHGQEFDAIHASPPCQAYMDTNANGAKASKHPRLIEPTRTLLISIGRPFVIENVHKAPIRPDLMLCGTMFGLRVIRHRYFELSSPAPFSPYSCNHWGQVASGDFIGVYGRGGKGHRHGAGVRDAVPDAPKVTAAEAMGIDWMTGEELSQAIPPCYTYWIGCQLMRYLRQVL